MQVLKSSECLCQARLLIWNAEQQLLLFENKVIYAAHWQTYDTDLWTVKACY